jgi:hypothetical protein
MSKSCALVRCAIVGAALCIVGCATTYQTRIGRPAIERIVHTELLAVYDVEVRPDFVSWSIEQLEHASAPATEDATGELSRGYHRFIRGVAEFARERKYVFLSAAIGRTFLKRGAHCGMIPCNPRRCCDFCRRPC